MNGFFAPRGGNLNKSIFKSSNARGVARGGMLKLQFDWYITVRLFSTRSDHSTPNHLSGHKLCLFLLRLKYYKQREMSKKIITNFKKMVFSLLPFHAGSPFSLFFKVVFPVSLIFSGRFSLLPKPFLSPLHFPWLNFHFW